MPRACVVCAHPERAHIDEALISRDSFAAVAGRFSLSPPSVRRHYHHHLPPQDRRGRPIRFYPGAAALLESLRKLHDSTARILVDNARLDPTIALRAIARLESQLRLLHQLDPDGSLSRSARKDAEIRHLIDQALQPFPEARSALIQVLAQAAAGIEDLPRAA